MAKENSTTETREYEIPILRIGYACKTITVIAASQEEAEDKALDIAGNFEFSERESEYKVVY